ncbi:MAG: hypothetical protein H6661_08470 [Ardenticatenaceae bacterium]|nr:hypothetical protein [Ardenticatenaceae bacterium]
MRTYDETAVAELEALGYLVNRWPTCSIYFGGAHSVSCTDDCRGLVRWIIWAAQRPLLKRVGTDGTD